MALIISNALGKSVRYATTPPDVYVAAMNSIGQSTSAAQGLVDMFTYLAAHYVAPGDADRSLTPTNLASWLGMNPRRS